MLAPFEPWSTHKPFLDFAAGSRDFKQWQSGSGQRIGASLRGKSTSVSVSRTSINVAKDLSNELDVSAQVAQTVLHDASEENFANLRSSAGSVVDKLGYVAGRTHLARNGDLHDDR